MVIGQNQNLQSNRTIYLFHWIKQNDNLVHEGANTLTKEKYDIIGWFQKGNN